MNSISPIGFLQLKWLITVDRLDKLDNQWAQLHQQTDVTKNVRMVIAQELMDQRKVLTLQRRRIESYLANDPRTIDSRYVEFAKYLDVARRIRAAIQNGESDEFIAAWLMEEFPSPEANRQRGRPKGTLEKYDGKVLCALDLYERDSAEWSFPKLADSLLGCHRRHVADSKCVDKLKKAVGRLRVFLQELGYKPVGK